MDYDYICKDCGHEFDWGQGVNTLGANEWVDCPHCKGGNVKDLTNEG